MPLLDGLALLPTVSRSSLGSWPYLHRKQAGAAESIQGQQPPRTVLAAKLDAFCIVASLEQPSTPAFKREPLALGNAQRIALWGWRRPPELRLQRMATCAPLPEAQGISTGSTTPSLFGHDPPSHESARPSESKHPSSLIPVPKMRGPALKALLLLALTVGLVVGDSVALTDIRVLLRTQGPENWWLSLQRPTGELEAIRLERCYRWTNQVTREGAPGEFSQVKFAPGPAAFPGATWSRSVSMRVFLGTINDDDDGCIDGPIASPTIDLPMIQPGQTEFSDNGDVALVNVRGGPILEQFSSLTKVLASTHDSIWHKGPFGIVDWCGTTEGEVPVMRRISVGFNGMHSPLLPGLENEGFYCQNVTELATACPGASLDECQWLNVSAFHVDDYGVCTNAHRDSPVAHWTLGVSQPGLDQPAWASTLSAIDGTAAAGRCSDATGPQLTATVVSMQKALPVAWRVDIDPAVFGALTNVSTTRPYPAPSPAPTPDPTPGGGGGGGGDIGGDPTWAFIASVASIPALLVYVCCMARDFCCIIPMQHSPDATIRGETLRLRTTWSTSHYYSESSESWKTSTTVSHSVESSSEAWKWYSGKIEDARVLYTPYGNLPMDGVSHPYRGSRFIGCSPRICGILLVTAVASTGTFQFITSEPLVLTCFVLSIVLLFPPWLLICTVIRVAQNKKAEETKASPSAVAPPMADMSTYNDLPGQ